MEKLRKLANVSSPNKLESKLNCDEVNELLVKNDLIPRKVLNIHLAVLRRNFEELEFLWNQGVPIDSRDEIGCTPLHIASAMIDSIGNVTKIPDLTKKKMY